MSFVLFQIILIQIHHTRLYPSRQYTCALNYLLADCAGYE